MKKAGNAAAQALKFGPSFAPPFGFKSGIR